MLSALLRMVSAFRAICSITRTKVSTVSLKELRSGSYSASKGVSSLCVRSPPATVCRATASRSTTRLRPCSMRARASAPSAASASCDCRSDRLRAIVPISSPRSVKGTAPSYRPLRRMTISSARAVTGRDTSMRRRLPAQYSRAASTPAEMARLMKSCDCAADRLRAEVHRMAIAPVDVAVSDPAKAGTACTNPSSETCAMPDVAAVRASAASLAASASPAAPSSASVSP